MSLPVPAWAATALQLPQGARALQGYGRLSPLEWEKKERYIVPRGILSEYGVQEPLLLTIHALYSQSKRLHSWYQVKLIYSFQCWTPSGLPIITNPACDFSWTGSRGVVVEKSAYGLGTSGSLLFTDDVVSLASSSQYLPHTQEKFTAKCIDAGVKVSSESQLFQIQMVNGLSGSEMSPCLRRRC